MNKRLFQEENILDESLSFCKTMPEENKKICGNIGENRSSASEIAPCDNITRA